MLKNFLLCMAILVMSGCATTITEPASLADIKIDIQKIDSENSPVIAVNPFNMSRIPAEVGVLTMGLLKVREAAVRVENLRSAEESFGKALRLLLQTAGCKTFFQDESKPQAADIILQAEVIHFEENVHFYLTRKLEYGDIVNCHLLFNLIVRDTKTNTAIIQRQLEGSGEAIATNVRPTSQRSDFGTADGWTLLMRELDETGYFKKAESLALISAVKPMFDDPTVIQAMLKRK